MWQCGSVVRTQVLGFPALPDGQGTSFEGNWEVNARGRFDKTLFVSYVFHQNVSVYCLKKGVEVELVAKILLGCVMNFCFPNCLGQKASKFS